MATRSIEINKETRFPLTVHTWTVDKIGNRLVATCSSRAGGKDGNFPFREGKLYLYNGIGSYYCYFRDKEFIEFLSQNGLTAVKREDPNKIYFTSSHQSGWGRVNVLVHTDGEISRKELPGKFDDVETGNACYDCQHADKVSGATWSVEYNFNDYRDSHSKAVILRTLVPIQKLQLPKRDWSK